MRDKGVEPENYNYGRATILDVTAIISINGRRSRTNMIYDIYLRISYSNILRLS